MLAIDLVAVVPRIDSDVHASRSGVPDGASRLQSPLRVLVWPSFSTRPVPFLPSVHEPLMRDLLVTRDEWIEHRRPDGERIGWMRPEGDDFVPVDLLGRDLSSATDWLSAEHALNEAGIG